MKVDEGASDLGVQCPWPLIDILRSLRRRGRRWWTWIKVAKSRRRDVKPILHKGVETSRIIREGLDKSLSSTNIVGWCL